MVKMTARPQRPEPHADKLMKTMQPQQQLVGCHDSRKPPHDDEVANPTRAEAPHEFCEGPTRNVGNSAGRSTPNVGIEKASMVWPASPAWWRRDGQYPSQKPNAGSLMMQGQGR